MNGHPYLEGFTLDICIGEYKCSYFIDGMKNDLYGFITSLGYTDTYIFIIGNVIVVSIGVGEDPSILIGNAEHLGNIYLSWIDKMISALAREGFHLAYDKFLEGIGNRVNVVVISSPFKRYSDNFNLEEDLIPLMDPENLYPRYGFMIQGIQVVTTLGVYALEIPLSCSLPDVGVEYNISSIVDILDGVIDIKNLLFGIDKEVIIIPTRKCYSVEPFPRGGTETLDMTQMDIPTIHPMKVREIYNVYIVSESAQVDRSMDKELIYNEGDNPHKSDSLNVTSKYISLILSSIAIIGISTILFWMKRRGHKI